MLDQRQRDSTVDVVMTSLGAFVILCAVGGTLAFQAVFGRNPQRAQTGPVIRFVWEHFWVLASVQLAVGVVLVLVGLALMWRRGSRRLSLLSELDAFFTDHHDCGDLDACVEGLIVWIACPCGARMARQVDGADDARRA